MASALRTKWSLQTIEDSCPGELYHTCQPRDTGMSEDLVKMDMAYGFGLQELTALSGQLLEEEATSLHDL